MKKILYVYVKSVDDSTNFVYTSKTFILKGEMFLDSEFRKIVQKTFPDMVIEVRLQSESLEEMKRAYKHSMSITSGYTENQKHPVYVFSNNTLSDIIAYLEGTLLTPYLYNKVNEEEE